MVMLQEKVKLEAYSLTFKDTFGEEYFEALEDLEPISPTATVQISMLNMSGIDTTIVIFEEAKNVKC